MSNWKTTTAGLLAAFIGTVGPLTAYLATTSNPKATEVCGVLTCAAAIARVWVGMLQNDALPTNTVTTTATTVTTPAVPASTETTVVTK